MRISLAKREFAIQLVQKGLIQRVVANRLHNLQGSISQLMKKVCQGFGLYDRPNSGRKRIITKRDERKLARESKKSPFKIANQLRRDCNL